MDINAQESVTPPDNCRSSKPVRRYIDFYFINIHLSSLTWLAKNRNQTGFLVD
jgi:hypothetical protein